MCPINIFFLLAASEGERRERAAPLSYGLLTRVGGSNIGAVCLASIGEGTVEAVEDEPKESYIGVAIPFHLHEAWSASTSSTKKLSISIRITAFTSVGF